MQNHGNLILPPRTKQWTVQRLRNKQGQIHAKGKRINSGSHGVCSAKRRAYRKYANRVTIHLEYARPTSHGYSVSF